MYEKYLIYLNEVRARRGGSKKIFHHYVKDLLKCPQHKNSILQQAREAGENEEDIQMDFHILQNKTSITAINIYHNALIFSQLFKVKLKKGCHLLMSLADMALQRNYKQSFVCYHDEGNPNILFLFHYTN